MQIIHPIRLFLSVILFLCCGQLTAAELGQLSPEQLEDLQRNGAALVVDVRTDKEWQATGLIANSNKLTFFDASGKANPEQWRQALEKLKSSPEQAVVLVCRSGNRSSRVGQFLINSGMKNVSHLTGGIQDWTQSGRVLQKDCVDLVCR